MTTWEAPDGATQRGRLPPEGRQIWHEDARGRRHGPAVRWYPDGQIRSLVEYDGGQRHGRYRAWHPDGTLAVEGGYARDREHGLWQSYDAQGSPQVRLPCESGASEGACQSFYPGGAVAREWTARSGREEGRVTIYLPDGQRFSEATFRAGRRHGRRTIWLAGARFIEDHWEDGALEGPYRMWSVTGQLLQQGQYASGERHGRWVFWGYTGRPIAEGDYEHGAVVGDWAPPDPIMPPPAAPALPPVRRDLAQDGPVATTVVTGFLGAGKTTVILDLLRQKPAGERWVVYVNEFGEVGVDAAAMPSEGDKDGLVVRELAGGCACCSSNRPFVEGVGLAIDTLRPDHLIVEPTGLADAGALIASMQERLAGRLELRATLCVVDPRRLDEPRYINNPAYLAQLRAADVAVANRCDLAGFEELDRFRELVFNLPNLSGVLETEMGRVDLAWLTLAPTLRSPGHHHHHTQGVVGRGFVFDAALRFSRDGVEAALREAMPPDWMRMKGALNGDDGQRWLLNVDERPGGLAFDWRAASDEGPSRFECIATASSEPGWEQLRSRLAQASSSSS